MNDTRERATIVIRKPKHCFNEMLWKWSFVKDIIDGLCGKIWLFGFLYDDTDSVLAAQRDFDDMADLERCFRFVGKEIFALMKRFGGRYQIVVHIYIISFRGGANFGIKIIKVNVVNFTIIN